MDHDAERSELHAAYAAGVPLDDAWIEFDPENSPDELELLRKDTSPNSVERIRIARERLLAALRQEARKCIGVTSLNLSGSKNLARVRPQICRMHHIADWPRGSIRDGGVLITNVWVELSAPKASRIQSKKMIDLLKFNDASPGAIVICEYAEKYKDWDGRLKDDVVNSLNVTLVSEYGLEPYFKTPVLRRSWSNYKKEIRLLLEKSGNTDFPLWLQNL